MSTKIIEATLTSPRIDDLIRPRVMEAICTNDNLDITSAGMRLMTDKCMLFTEPTKKLFIEYFMNTSTKGWSGRKNDLLARIHKCFTPDQLKDVLVLPLYSQILRNSDLSDDVLKAMVHHLISKLSLDFPKSNEIMLRILSVLGDEAFTSQHFCNKFMKPYYLLLPTCPDELFIRIYNELLTEYPEGQILKAYCDQNYDHGEHYHETRSYLLEQVNKKLQLGIFRLTLGNTSAVPPKPPCSAATA